MIVVRVISQRWRWESGIDVPGLVIHPVRLTVAELAGPLSAVDARLVTIRTQLWSSSVLAGDRSFTGRPRIRT